MNRKTTPGRTIPGLLLAAALLVPTAHATPELEDARHLFRQADFEACATQVASVLERDDLSTPDRRDAWILAARCEVAFGRSAEARQSFCRALELDPFWRPDANLLTHDEIAAFDATLASCGPAQNLPAPPKKPWFGVQAHGGYARYSMSDVSAYADRANLAHEVVFGAPLGLESPSSGVQYGVQAVVGYGRFRLEAGYERLNGESSASSSDLKWSLDLPGSAIVGTVLWTPPLPSKAILSLGGGVGRYTSMGEETIAASDGTSETYEWKGDGVGLHALGTLELPVHPRLRLLARLGYRSAKATNVTDGTDSLGSDFTIDWSGPFAGIGATAVLAR